jgi:hypothetical protein
MTNKPSDTPRTDKFYDDWMAWGAGEPRPNGHLAKLLVIARDLERELARYKQAEAELPEVPFGLLDALRKYQRQIDADGTEVGVSRQAVDEACDLIDALGAHAAKVTVERDDLKAERANYGEIYKLTTQEQKGLLAVGEELIRLKAKLAAAEKDAERWQRARKHGILRVGRPFETRFVFNEEADMVIDATIDAAREKEKT